MEEEQYTEREEKGAADRDLYWRGFEVGHLQEQNWQYIRVWSDEVCLLLFWRPLHKTLTFSSSLPEITW
jgi:hypothetical protein